MTSIGGFTPKPGPTGNGKKLDNNVIQDYLKNNKPEKPEITNQQNNRPFGPDVPVRDPNAPVYNQQNYPFGTGDTIGYA